MVGIGLPMAMMCGTLYALAANAVSYFADRSKKTGVDISPEQQFGVEMGAFCTYLVGGFLSTLAYAMGDPVPLLQGALVATNLLLNMIFQTCLGISAYTKPMRIGTLIIFVVVMFQLAEVGPESRNENVNVMAAFSKPSATTLFIIFGALMVLSGLGVGFTQNRPPESSTKIFMWSLHIGVMGSGTDNAASTFGVIDGFMRYAAFAAYGLVSVYILGISARAPGVCDASVYVPLQLSLQLLLNMITGIFVWDDLNRMSGKSVQTYVVTFVVIILGVYVASPSADLVDSIVRWRLWRTTNLSNEVASSAFGKSVLVLMGSWRKIQTAPGKESEDAAREALKRTLSIGAERGIISSQELVDLAVDLYNGDAGSFAPSAAFMKWLSSNSYLNEYLMHDPTFHQSLLDLLPKHEIRKLPQSFALVRTIELSDVPASSLLHVHGS